jgi:hypothetical protein
MVINHDILRSNESLAKRNSIEISNLDFYRKKFGNTELITLNQWQENGLSSLRIERG